ncbi:MAG: hypothetical protein K5Q68_02640 [Roseococcus sp.]|nr:hypothetical protein [Roseococcus sp.]
MELHVFHALVAVHIVTGSIGAIAFWVPVIGRKGGVNHKRWGKVFTICMLATGAFAICMSLLTIYEPMATHPHLEGMFEAPFIRGIFGWLMLHMGILTINLAWYGWLCVQNRRDHARNLTWFNVALQFILIAAAVNSAIQGWIIGQFLMIGLTVVGLATAGTNLRFLYKPVRGEKDWLDEHIKALVGAGISVYTAFFAFGSVRILPELALHPGLWSIPLITGLALIIYHQRRVAVQFRARRAAESYAG